jgi:hypothetical protein
MAGNNKTKNNNKQKKNKGAKSSNNVKSNMNKKSSLKGKTTALGKIIKSAGSIGGSLLGHPGLGKTMGGAISRIFGQGDYEVKSNSFLNGGPPSFAAMNTGIRMAHREYIGDIFSNTGFGISQYSLSPSSAVTFPWLSQIATNFEEYRYHGLVFYFNTTSGNAVSSTNNALGVVGMVTQYNPSLPPLPDKRTCEDYAGCVSTVPSMSLLHPVECKLKADALQRYFVQVDTISNAEDLKFYSPGNFNVFTAGQQAANINLGELWVSYDVEFYNPKILPIGTVRSAAGKASINPLTSTQTAPLGTAPVTAVGNLKWSYDGAGVITVPQGTAAGYYMFQWDITLNAATTWEPTVAFLTNMQVWDGLNNNTTSALATPATPATTTFGKSVTVLFYKPDSMACQFRIGKSAAVTEASINDCIMVKVPNQLGNLGAFVLSAPKKTDYEVLLSKLRSDLGMDRPDPSVYSDEDYVDYQVVKKIKRVI